MRRLDLIWLDWRDGVGALLLLFGVLTTAAACLLTAGGILLVVAGHVIAGLTVTLGALAVVALCGLQCWMIGSDLWGKVKP